MHHTLDLPFADEAEPGSFRDPNAQVFYRGGAVCRGLGPRALEEWEALAATAFFRRFTTDGKLVATERADDEPGWAAVLRHEAVPFVSYPYEWTLGMLRDAALLQLELLEAALAEGMTLKDGSAFNVQWRGAGPVFIDVPSLVRLAPGEPWAGYRQLCQTCLYPLLLQAYRGVPFRPWLRGSIDGIPAEQLAALLSLRDLFRPGVFLHVKMQAWLQRRARRSATDVKRELRAAGFRREMILANVRGLRRIVERLRWCPPPSAWSGYEDELPYSAAARERKEAFVRRVTASRPWRLAWDLGCNTGAFARIAAEHSRHVVAADADQAAVERLYQGLKAEGETRILPLVWDLADPSPALGWRGRERKTLEQRGRPQLTLCLALLHHAALGRNLPLAQVVDWLAGLTEHLVVEFVTRQDPMVQRLLRQNDEARPEYDLPVFERLLSGRFEVLAREELPGGTRVLYHAQARAGGSHE